MRFRQGLMTFSNAPRRKAGLLFAATLAGAVAGCGGPPALTSRATESNLASSYFDAVIRNEEPATVKSAEEYLVFRFNRDRSNNSDFIRRKIAEGGGNCRVNQADTMCTLNRQINVEDCFRGSCSKRIKKWTLQISWRNSQNSIQPRVKINMTTQQLSN
jgi:hypothetical protein